MLNNVVGTKYPAPAEIVAQNTAVDNIVGSNPSDPNGYIGGAASTPTPTLFGNYGPRLTSSDYSKYNTSNSSDENKDKTTPKTDQTSSKKKTGGGNTQTGNTVTSEVAPGFKWIL
jgi:hypothetical protein